MGDAEQLLKAEKDGRLSVENEGRLKLLSRSLSLSFSFDRPRSFSRSSLSSFVLLNRLRRLRFVRGGLEAAAELLAIVLGKVALCV